MWYCGFWAFEVLRRRLSIPIPIQAVVIPVYHISFRRSQAIMLNGLLWNVALMRHVGVAGSWGQALRPLFLK